MEKIPLTPPKGTTDWQPQEFAIRKYIFDTWRQVCRSYGYQEYLTPLIESADLYRAKSGEDVGGTELTTFTDRGGRELAIRPEMTPSVTRMVASSYRDYPKPIRLFSIANFFRNEKPQRGRNREFWQLNFDIFGAEQYQSDLEVLRVALDIMLAFSPPKNSFVVHINHRELIDAVLDEAGVTSSARPQVVRILDKWSKLPEDKALGRLAEIGVSNEGGKLLGSFMQTTSPTDLLELLPGLADNTGYQAVMTLLSSLEQAEYGDWVLFQPNVIRGFDYYDGMVFEVFDLHPDNQRALFGGGRYNGLATIFGTESFPAVGCAPGDETLRLFLESWKLLPSVDDVIQPTYYFPRLLEQPMSEYFVIARQLRSEATVLESIKHESIADALREADRRGASYIVLYGSEEQERGVYVKKDLTTGEEQEIKISE